MKQILKVLYFIFLSIALASIPIQWDSKDIMIPISQQIVSIMVVAWILKFTYKQIDKLT